LPLGSSKACDYSLIFGALRAAILSRTQPAAQWPKVAVTLTTEP
jgi:hypothetical protein